MNNFGLPIRDGRILCAVCHFDPIFFYFLRRGARDKKRLVLSIVPGGTVVIFWTAFPALKCWATFTVSLWDQSGEAHGAGAECPAQPHRGSFRRIDPDGMARASANSAIGYSGATSSGVFQLANNGISSSETEYSMMRCSLKSRRTKSCNRSCPSSIWLMARRSDLFG
jgi:hypothetical protein